MKQKNNNLLLQIVVVALASSMLCACTEKEESVDQEMMQKNISFAVSADPEGETPATRGSQVTTLSSFGMIATVYPSNETYTGQSLGNYFYNLEVEPLVPTIYLWPTADHRMAFYGHYPYGNANISISSQGTVGPPAYTYTVPESISSQVDFMTTEVLDHTCGSQNPLALTFHHRLSDIRFTAVNDQSAAIIVKSVSLLGVKYVGILSGNTWTPSGDVNTALSHPFTLTCNTSVAAGSSSDLTGTTNHFLMIPQTVGAETEMITVVTEENSEEKTYTYELPSSVTLSAGQVYNYTLTFSESSGLIVSTDSDIEDWEE